MNNLTLKLLVFGLLGLALVYLVQDVEADDSNELEKNGKSQKQTIEDLLYEYDQRKLKLYREKFCYNQDLAIQGKKYRRICPDFNRNYLKFFLSLFMIIAIGALIRTLLKRSGLNIPYTVILMVFGLVLGFISWDKDSCVRWSMYTRIARTPPKIILYIFLPVLIYESAFGMKAHVFYRSSISIMVLAFPGMVICTFITAFVCSEFFYSYKWSFMDASLYGSIISATDPVAVVAILREVGASEMLSTMIEGESLLNDGTAILFYELFTDVVAPEADDAPLTAGGIVIKFFVIALGGPVFGYIMAKLSIAFLSRIFNDAAVEVSITLTAAYLTYYIGEAYLGVSGVMAVVVLGIVISAERTAISPEVQGLVRHFWEMLGYLANTVLFVLVGVVISETAINNVTLEDGYYLLFLYFAINISRFLMILILSPILSRVGYGLSWQNLLLMTWSGLRGAVGICLALEVFRNRELCERPEIGPKFLLQTAGIVLLTLIINGTTTKLLLDTLKLSEISVGKIQDMYNAVRQIQAAQQRAIETMKQDQLLSDCNFKVVAEYASIRNPYAKHKSKKKKKQPSAEDGAEPTPSLLLDPQGRQYGTDPDAGAHEPSVDEYKQIIDESRLRLLKAMKVSYWRQYEQGLMAEESVQILVEYVDKCEDQPYKMFHSDDLKKHWEVHGFVAWMRNKLLPFTVSHLEEDEVPLEPDGKFRQWCHRIVTNFWFDGLIHVIIILNLIPIIWETVEIATDHQFTYQEVIGFLVTNIVFTSILALEFTIKMLGFGCSGYWNNKWNILDAIVLVVSLVEICLSSSYLSEMTEQSVNGKVIHGQADIEFLKFMRFIRILRIVRVVRLFRPLIPRFMNYLNGRVNRVLFFGYDIAKGSACAIDDVMKFLPQMIDNRKVHARFKTILDKQRLILLLEMGLIQKDHPGIAVAIKTRHANRAVLNQLRQGLNELKEDGLLDQTQYDVLLHEIETKMKGIWHIPNHMQPRSPEMVLADLQWVSGTTALLNYLLDKAAVIQFAVGDIICAAGDEANGIYAIVSGVAKITYQPFYELILLRERYGIIPNADIFSDPIFETEMTDYYTTGAVLGELGVLTGAAYASTVTCETSVSVYHIPQSVMNLAMQGFNDRYDSLEGRLWRTFGIKVAAAVLPQEAIYQALTMDKIKSHLELSAVPMGDEYLTLSIPPFITDVVLIYGRVQNDCPPNEYYTAPCLIPSTVTKITQVPQSPVRPRILLIASEETLEMESNENEDEGDIGPGSCSVIRQYLMTASKPANIDENQVRQLSRRSVTVNFGVRRAGGPEEGRSPRSGNSSGSSSISSVTRRPSALSRRAPNTGQGQPRPKN